MNRGRRREKIFLTYADYERFIEVLQETSGYLNLKIACYCLMPNHYHILVQTPDGNLPRCMRHINGVYTQRFNRHHKTDGQLFRGRYKAILVDTDQYLLELLRYIHRNPLRTGIVQSLDDFKWSSHHAYLSKSKEWYWLERELLQEMLTTKKNMRKKRYLAFVGEDESEELKQFYALPNLPSILGCPDFKAWVKETFMSLGLQPEIPDSRILTPKPEKIISIVCQHFKISKDELHRTRRGFENIPRDISINLVRFFTGKTLKEVGKYFAITNYSTVSSAIERVNSRKKQNKSLVKNLAILTQKITKSQKQT